MSKIHPHMAISDNVYNLIRLYSTTDMSIRETLTQRLLDFHLEAMKYRNIDWSKRLYIAVGDSKIAGTESWDEYGIKFKVASERSFLWGEDSVCKISQTRVSKQRYTLEWIDEYWRFAWEHHTKIPVFQPRID